MNKSGRATRLAGTVILIVWGILGGLALLGPHISSKIPFIVNDGPALSLELNCPVWLAPNQTGKSSATIANIGENATFNVYWEPLDNTASEHLCNEHFFLAVGQTRSISCTFSGSQLGERRRGLTAWAWSSQDANALLTPSEYSYVGWCLIPAEKPLGTIFPFWFWMIGGIAIGFIIFGQRVAEHCQPAERRTASFANLKAGSL